MEPGAIFDMVINAPKDGYIIGAIISATSDDDSTMKAHLKHKKSTKSKIQRKVTLMDH